MARRDPSAYEEMSQDIETGNFTVRGPVEVGATLRMGRPAKGAPSAGKSPTLSTRYPAEMRTSIADLAKSEGIGESELVRKAVAEYLNRHTSAAP